VIPRLSLLLLAPALLGSTSGPAHAGPTHSSAARLISSAATHQRAVALTFDAGADRGYAPSILRTLERVHVRATFGMTGRWARMNPDLVRRMTRDRDTFINHTYDHRSFTGYSTGTRPLDQGQRMWEIEQAEKAIRQLSGHGARPYFRPPYGDYDGAALALLGRLGYSEVVMWTVDSLGWDHLPAPAILQRCLAAAHPGTIFLMHVGIQSQDALALPTLIADLKRRGYRFFTVPQLLRLH
jgi:peptidoglycan/xylan/chitin deacetylase (PgdA/CDA1 family)